MLLCAALLGTGVLEVATDAVLCGVCCVDGFAVVSAIDYLLACCVLPRCAALLGHGVFEVGPLSFLHMYSYSIIVYAWHPFTDVPTRPHQQLLTCAGRHPLLVGCNYII